MAPTYLSVDDTDSLDGMCTTYLGTLLIESLLEYDLIGLPRLVRLNPNVPWKTRGNAAVSLAFGKGKGKRIRIGEISGEPIYCYSTGSRADPGRVFSMAEKIIEQNAHFSCKKTNPGMVVAGKRPSSQLYWKTVREIVPLKDAEKEVKRVGGKIKKFKNGRGVIGASASMAWRPRDFTFEVLAYRQKRRIGSKRMIDVASVRKMDRAMPSTFHNIDLSNGHVAIAPASPCPILFGIRGDNPWDLLRAKDVIVSEPIDRWLLFLTNQGTDDHLMRRHIADIIPREGVKLRGIVSRDSNTIVGGHVFFEIKDSTGAVTCAVYEPSGQMCSAARELRTGDRVTVFGSVRETPLEVNVEKFHIDRIIPVGDKIENPICPSCGKHMKSIGRGAGFRCRKCGLKANEDSVRFSLRKTPSIGWYEPPIASRRHLYKPVKRFDIKRSSLREILYIHSLDKASKRQ